MPKFDNLRKKLRRRRIEAMLLAGYVFAITFALFISLINKSTEETYKLPIQHIDENYDFSADVLTPAFNDSVADNPFENVYDTVNNIKLLSSNAVIMQKFTLVQNGKEVIMPVTSKPKSPHKYALSELYQKEHRVLVVDYGDTFIGMLTDLGMDTKNATEAYSVLSKVYDARRMKPNQYIELTATFDIQSRQLETLDTLIIVPERGIKYILRVNEYDKYEAVVEREKFAQDVKVISGKIDGQVIKSMTNSGVPGSIANETVNRMSHMLDFRNALRKGNKFSVKYDVSKAANGDVVNVGGLLSASFETSQKTYKIYRYKDSFYDDNGRTKKTGLDIKPLSARNARISSLFGYRRHPIYKTNKFHSGVDYAAPKGTAIYASGNGVVIMAQYVNGYGNYVKIRHNSEYETAYGHMQKFAPGVHRGTRVRKGQIIGYVGNTGRSTGPHLHFEVIRKGQKINPLKAKVATGNDLTGAQLAEFKRVMREIDAKSEKIVKKTEAAPQLQSVANILSADAEAAELIAEIEAKEQYEQELNKINEEKNLTGKPLAIAADLKVGQDSAIDMEKSVADKELKSEEIARVDELNAKTDVNLTDNINKIDGSEFIKYKGKIVRPVSISVIDARARYQEKYLRLRHLKVVKVPVRKPKYARR